MSKKITLTAHKMTPKLAEYVEIFGHRPSPETFKFRTPAEIEEMAEVALMRKKPVKDWVTRPNRKTGTILDNLYKQDTDIQDSSLPRAEPEVSEKISKKELRKAAIQEHDESQKSKKQLKKNRAKTIEAQEQVLEYEPLVSSYKKPYSAPNQSYGITYSQASKLKWRRSSAKNELKPNNSDPQVREGVKENNKSGKKDISLKIEADTELINSHENSTTSSTISMKLSNRIDNLVGEALPIVGWSIFLYFVWTVLWFPDGGLPTFITVLVFNLCAIFLIHKEKFGLGFIWCMFGLIPSIYATAYLLNWLGIG